MITRDQFIKSMLGTGLAASPLSSAQQPATKKGKTTVERTDVISVRAGAVAKIDAWSHAIPRPYLDRLTVLPAGPHSAVVKLILSVPALSDMDHRFRTMDRFGNYTQVLTPMPGLHLTMALGDRKLADELVRLSNDGLAEFVSKHPDRFKGFAALLPLYDPEQALIELDRVVKLGALGVQIETSINGVPLDDPRFEPLFARMADLQRPLWIHPVRSPLTPDYPSEKTSRFAMSTALGWPYETSVALSRLVFSGHLERHPKLRIIGHHGGGMIPHFSGRLGHYLETWGPKLDPEVGTALQSLKKPLLDYFRMFYVDTAMNGAKQAVACVLEFFGPDHVLFGTDTPFDPEEGRFVQDVIADIESLAGGELTRKRIYNVNAVRVFGVT
jgi:aminocarboxymuconate-semialdehyde decarboxylase